jgi:ornithine--oxo-acid transaminase
VPLLPGLLAEQPVTRSPANIERAFFCNSGSEAVESAIKFARELRKCDRILYHIQAFHGLTIGALSLNRSAGFRSDFEPLMPDTTEVPLEMTEVLGRPSHCGKARGIRRNGPTIAPDHLWTDVLHDCID